MPGIFNLEDIFQLFDTINEAGIGTVTRTRRF